MTIEERTSGAVTIVDVQGRLTIEVLGSMPLAEKARQLLHEGHSQILMNLAGVAYMDTSGLCNVVEAYLAVTRRGGCLKLLHLTPHVRRLLEVTRLLTVFQAYDSEAEAVASFGSDTTVRSSGVR